MADAGVSAPVPADAMPGLRRVRRTQGSRDVGNAWVGSADAIVAAGLATMDEFPGQPGRPELSVSYRPVAGKQADREPPSEQMRTIAALLRPMSVQWSKDKRLCMFGTVAAARVVPMLVPHGLPGDPGRNKTSYTFRLLDGRRVGVKRSPGVDKVWVFVRESIEEARAVQAAAEAEWAAERRATQAKEKADDDAARERARTPDSYRRCLEFTLESLEDYLCSGKLCGKYSQPWRMPAGVRAEIDEHLKALQGLIKTTPLLPVDQQGRPVLALVSGGRRAQLVGKAG